MVWAFLGLWKNLWLLFTGVKIGGLSYVRGLAGDCFFFPYCNGVDYSQNYKENRSKKGNQCDNKMAEGNSFRLALNKRKGLILFVNPWILDGRLVNAWLKRIAKVWRVSLNLLATLNNYGIDRVFGRFSGKEKNDNLCQYLEASGIRGRSFSVNAKIILIKQRHGNRAFYFLFVWEFQRTCQMEQNYQSTSRKPSPLFPAYWNYFRKELFSTLHSKIFARNKKRSRDRHRLCDWNLPENKTGEKLF